MGKVEVAVEKFKALVEAQLKRVEEIKSVKDFKDYAKLDKIVIGVCGGDGIGPVITNQAQRVLEFLLKDEVAKGKIEFRVIDGLTIENRVEAGKAIPDDVLAELDDLRQNFLLKSIENGIQTILTSVDTLLFDEEFLERVQLIRVENGVII